MTTASSINPSESVQAISTHAPGLFTADAAALRGSAAFWLLAALAGQWAFLYYIAAFYGVSTLSGDFEVWNRLAALGRTPYVVGDTMGNLAFAAHALGAGVVASAARSSSFRRFAGTPPYFIGGTGVYFS
jgi:hypothetical protein